MSRLVDCSVARDLNWGFDTWSYVFRSQSNSNRTIYACGRRHVKETVDTHTAIYMEKELLNSRVLFVESIALLPEIHKQSTEI